MAKRNFDFRKVLAPSDASAFVAIGIGLVIGLALDEMAVRLIGVCIAILGCVALFMMISPRLAELSMQGRPPRPSESPSLTSETTRDAQSKRRVFERAGFVEEFGTAEEGTDPAFIDENQTQLFDEPPKPVRTSAARVVSETPLRSESAARSEALVGTRFEDIEGSSVRIVGVRKAGTSARTQQAASRAQEPAKAKIEERSAQRPAVTTAAPPTTSTKSTDSNERVIDAGDGDTIVIRPKKASSEAPKIPAQEATAPAVIESKQDIVNEPGKPAESTPEVTSVETPSAESATTVSSTNVLEEPAVEDVHVTHDAAPQREEVPVPVATERTTRRQQPDVAVTLFTDDVDEDDSSIAGEPRKEFDYLLNRVLMVIRSATNARTAAFFWVNWERQQLVVEAKITEATDAFTDVRKIPIGRDALSQIVQEGRPEILTEISPEAELDLLPYYKHGANTVSFIGVPVYYRGKVVGVLCADSLVEEAYSEITVGFFGQFTKLISGLVRSYTNSFDLIQTANIYKATTHLSSLLNGIPATKKEALKATFEATINAMDVSTIGAVLYNHDARAWTVADVKSVKPDYSNVLNNAVDIQHSAIGKAILTGDSTTVNAPDPSIRVVDAEPMLESGQFAAIPLRTSTNTYGALFMENAENAFTHQDLMVVEAIGEHVGTVLEVLELTDSLKGAALLDRESGVLNSDGFNARIREEFTRSLDFQSALTICYVQIDKSRVTSATSTEQTQRIFMHVINLLREQLREYDVIAKLDDTLIGIALIGYKAQQAQMFIESMRGRIASSVIDVDGKRFTVTISVGVAEASARDSAESLMRNVQTALHKSSEVGNRVTVF